METSSSKIESYINEICSYVRYKKARQEIRIELLDHLEEKITEEIALGMQLDAAEEKAISQMGSAEIIGKQLNESHREVPEWGLLILAVLFSFIGLLTAYFIESNGIGLGEVDFYKSILFNLLGYVTIGALYLFDYRNLEKYAKHIYIGITLVLIFQLLMGVAISGQIRWIHVIFLNIDITELSLFLYTIALAKILKDLDWNNIKHVIYGFIMLCIPMALYTMLNTLMPTMIYFVVFVVLMFFMKAKKIYIFLIIGLVGVGTINYISSAPYRLTRLLSFLYPHRDAQGAGWLNIQIAKVLKSAGYFGQGFTFPSKAIPGVQSDFVLTYIIYTFGWVVGISIIVLALVFIGRMLVTSRKVKNSFGSLIIQSFMCIFALEFLWNILMIVGLAPITSVGLPFISYGGSHVVTQMAAVGIIMSIYKGKSLTKIVCKE